MSEEHWDFIVVGAGSAGAAFSGRAVECSAAPRARAALGNGVSKDEIREILLHAMVYSGVPSAVEGFRCAREVFAELGVAE